MNAKIRYLKYPQDQFWIALLSIPEFQTWYASQDPTEMIFLGQDAKFKKFLFWAYMWKLGLLRYVLKIKRICSGWFGEGRA